MSWIARVHSLFSTLCMGSFYLSIDASGKVLSPGVGYFLFWNIYFLIFGMVNAESRADPLISLYEEIMQMPDLYCVLFLKKKR